MSKYKIRVFERVYYDVTVTAETREEAEKLTLRLVRDGDEGELDMVEVDSGGWQLAPHWEQHS